MKLFFGELDFLKGNWSAFVRSVWNLQIGGNFAPSAAFLNRNVPSVSYLPQPGTAKIKMISHDFEGFPLKKQNVEVKKGIGLCCPDFYSF